MKKESADVCLEGKPLSPAESLWSSRSDQTNNTIKVSEELSPESRQSPQTLFETTTSSCNRLSATVFLQLPQGSILHVVTNASVQNNDVLSHVLRRGDCFLDLLQGKGAQTMLLNAFCGHAKRRMYARIKW